MASIATTPALDDSYLPNEYFWKQILTSLNEIARIMAAANQY
jgi:hypothetical protein